MTKVVDLGFLSDVKLNVIPTTAKKGIVAVPKLPEEADLRLFANGRVYPSKAFAEKYSLEFVPRTSEIKEGSTKETYTVHGNGLEIFSSKDWGMVMGKLPTELIFCAVVPKALAKVDMWASTKYEDDNTPKASVFTQGANNFAKNRLVPMVADIYGVDWSTTQYVDLKVVEDQVLASENGLYHLPKIVMSGDHKGKPDYIRRENLTVNPMIVFEVKAKDDVEVAKEESAADNAPDIFQKTEDPQMDASKDWNLDGNDGTPEPTSES